MACKKFTKHFPGRVVSAIHHFAKYEIISKRTKFDFKVKRCLLSPAVDLIFLKFRILRLLAKCIFSKPVFHVFVV